MKPSLSTQSPSRRLRHSDSRSPMMRELQLRCSKRCKLNRALRQILRDRSPLWCSRRTMPTSSSRSNQSSAMRPHSKAALMPHKTKRSFQMTMRAISELSPQKPLNRSKGSITFLYFMVWDYFLLQVMTWIDLCKCRGPFLTLLLQIISSVIGYFDFLSSVWS